MNASPTRAAIVTGGSRGIGRAIATRLAADGFAVVVNYASNAAAAQETVGAIVEAGGTAIAVQGDVASEADVARLFDTTVERFGSVDVVVNSAGVMSMAAIDTEQLEAFDRTIATNLRGTFLVLAQAAKRMQRGGRIIALSTSVIALSFPGYGPYIASKAGVEGLVRVLANELRGRGITANVVSPGPVATELFFNGKTDEQVAKLAKLAPLERLGEPEDIASAVSFLAGPDGAWVNAQVLRVNGGYA
ncbi:SDR family oxidoreductase [Burkholderia gladioli]|uniref:SDR family oxidoreductase n=1 Tax=Burkholderia gladioli TaxID=28095 RepID=UPI000BF0AE29|nr:SDR family oxidoreductase [Burkholderia gladioli]KAF1060557.1 3-oxoacyl-[acyl-carrier-protein] reductase FabG [Burkholderia gladioli]PEH82648.1 3-ketoacyl-ACP reductase [Burkholderia gladioli]WAG24558.1 SDR family oxidoreductase [Burkholderia gladioli]